MCGIALLVEQGRTDSLVRRVSGALQDLAHRGPDDRGVLGFDPATGTAYAYDRTGAVRVLHPEKRREGLVPFALGNCRLSIIDRGEGGHQPMVTEDGRFSLIFNGEIYNYLEIRRDLERIGATFASHSDTEVLLRTFAEWGVDGLDRLRGMYAFVVIDLQEGRLVAARDCFGIKPLFYAVRDGLFALASEIGPVLTLARVPPMVNAQRVHDYLDRGLTDFGTETMFRDIHIVPPATYLDVSLRKPTEFTCVRYWHPRLDTHVDLTPGEAVARTRELVFESVALHMRSDVPVGALLSGGLDSSTVVTAMREVSGASTELHTFSYVGRGEAINEEPWFDEVNRVVGGIAHRCDLSPEDWSADIVDLVRSQGEPFGSLAIHAQHRLYRLAREAGVPVVLVGQGGDEIFAGYERFAVARLASLIRDMDLRQARGILRRVPVGRSVRLMAAALGWAYPARAAWPRRMVRRRRSAVDPRWAERHGTSSRLLPSVSSLGSPGSAFQEEILRSFAVTLPILLRYDDRNGMAHSVEGRVPFLSRDLAEFVLQLPPELLVDDFRVTKRLLREAMRGMVPDAVLNRPNRVGFSVPSVSWSTEIPRVQQFLQQIRTREIVRAEVMDALIDATTSGARPGRGQAALLWKVVGLAAWLEVFGAEL